MSGRIGDFSDSEMLAAFLEALESANVGVCVIVAYPERLETSYSNAPAFRMSGLGDLKQHPFSTLAPEEAAKLTKLRWAVRRGEAEGPPMIVTRYVHPNGREVPVAVGLGYALLGEQRATFCFLRDLTEHRAMESALRESEDRFRKLAEASPDSITIYIGETCVYANPKALELFGLRDASELASFNVRTLIAPERQAEADEIWARLRRGQNVPFILNRRVLPNGELRTLEASLSRSTFNGKTATLVFTRDVTERERLSADMMKQDRLASLGVLAAGVAHELNNPLAALSLLVRRTRTESALGNGDTALLGEIDDAVGRMKTIINDLLFLARPGDELLAHVDLGRVLSSSLTLLRAGITDCPPVMTDIDALPVIVAAPSRLGQVFVNVIRNAIEAVHGVENGTIAISGRLVGTDVVITVKDNGVGIPDHVLPKLMTPFLTTKDGGTGLGLWISRAIVESHRGRLEVASQQGVGTTVTIVLPT